MVDVNRPIGSETTVSGNTFITDDLDGDEVTVGGGVPGGADLDAWQAAISDYVGDNTLGPGQYSATYQGTATDSNGNSYTITGNTTFTVSPGNDGTDVATFNSGTMQSKAK
jgi:hypothetical protein